MKVYLAGPMSIVPKDYNFPAFISAAKFLRDQGFEVFSPAEADMERYGTDDIEIIKTKANYKECLTVDLNWILEHAEGIVLLPGWEKSKGVAVELSLAKALGLDQMFLEDIGDGLWALGKKAY